MMKFVAVLALVLVAVAASEYFKQPKYPCAYEMKIKGLKDDKEIAKYKIYVNGRYLYCEIKEDEEEAVMLIRPDIGGEGNVTLFYVEDKYCYVEPVEMEEAAYLLDLYSKGVLMYEDGRNWDHKKSEKWQGKECDHYYDDDDDDESIYVYDDHIYGLVERRYAYIIEYEWKSSMDDFVMKEKDFPECVKQEKKVSEVPSEDYIMCAASSLKVAFAAILAALLVALF